jgi:hypothetical protein
MAIHPPLNTGQVDEARVAVEHAILFTRAARLGKIGLAANARPHPDSGKAGPQRGGFGMLFAGRMRFETYIADCQRFCRSAPSIGSLNYIGVLHFINRSDAEQTHACTC